MTLVESGLAAVTQMSVWLAAMAVLIFLSALFSGSEAAYFSLRERDLRRLGKAGVMGRQATQLLADPERLLSAILFWNLLINMTYFAIAAILGAKLEQQPDAGNTLAVLFTAGSLLTIIFFSEMLPKSVAVLSPLRVSLWVAAPLTVAVRLVSPALPAIRAANVAARRLIWPTFQPEPVLDLADIERAIELGTDDAALLQRERNALRSLVTLSDVRADELMRPRGKLTIATLPIDPHFRVAESPSGGYLYLASGDDQSIVAATHVRMLRPSQWGDLEAVAEPVIYVGWSAKVAQVFESLMDQQRRVAIVVDEFGEPVGAISVEDILRGVLSPSDAVDEDEDSIVPLGDERWRLSGAISLRVLAKHLGVEEPEERVATVAGYMQRHNQRLPRVGDSAQLDRFRLEVVDEAEDQLWIEASGEGVDDSAAENGDTR